MDDGDGNGNGSGYYDDAVDGDALSNRKTIKVDQQKFAQTNFIRRQTQALQA